MALRCPPELDYKTLLLKTLCTLVVGHREINLKLTKRLPLCWLAFTVLEGTVQVTGGEKSPTVLASTGLCMLQYLSSRQDVPTCAISYKDDNHFFLIGFEARSIESNPCLVL